MHQALKWLLEKQEGTLGDCIMVVGAWTEVKEAAARGGAYRSRRGWDVLLSMSHLEGGDLMCPVKDPRSAQLQSETVCYGSSVHL